MTLKLLGKYLKLCLSLFCRTDPVDDLNRPVIQECFPVEHEADRLKDPKYHRIWHEEDKMNDLD